MRCYDGVAVCKMLCGYLEGLASPPVTARFGLWVMPADSPGLSTCVDLHLRLHCQNALLSREALVLTQAMSGSMVCCPSANSALCLGPRLFPALIKRASRTSGLSKGYNKALHNVETADASTSHRLALAVTVAPLLIPLQAACQEQTVLEQAGSVSPEVAGWVAVYVSLFQTDKRRDD